MTKSSLALGIGWRPELALFIDRRENLSFVEVTAENIFDAPIPQPLKNLRNRGIAVIPHGIGLSLGGAERPDSSRLQRLRALSEDVQAPLVSEHIAFVRAEGQEAGHLLPIPRTRQVLNVLCENVKIARDWLPVPLALENIATVFEWPGAEMDEGDFLTEVLDRTGTLLLLDIANLYCNAMNHRIDALKLLEKLPLERLAYVHVGGGFVRPDGIYVDSHAHPLQRGVLELLAELPKLLSGHSPVPGFQAGVMLERDDHYPPDAELAAELSMILSAACGICEHNMMSCAQPVEAMR